MFMSQFRICKPLINSRLPLFRPFLSRCFDLSFSTMADTEDLVPKAAGVFWDVEDYKIPDGLTARDVAENIRATLAEVGHRGPITIRAFASDKNRTPDYEFAYAGIKLKRVARGPKGEHKHHRRDMALLGDMGFYAGSHGKARSMIIFISDSNYDDADKEFRSWNHVVLWAKLSAEGKPIPQTRRTSKRI
ncbi:PREDICTED: uncharacterized protein LOC104699861 [Camelina sativa]|uniref:Uncharacterized protein LOC104699861 n=1 Tax=Camelina sativa TaxID=90675 RepID=A0ABM0SMW0_CAMSA|nr:PREDICTED: uncharacterized protein LOC104699861 [Camelina sativa]